MLRTSNLFFDLSILGIAIMLFSSCDNPEEKERPSPLRVDSTEIAGVLLKITYSSPAVKNRKIWGGLEPLGKVWRIGANKATVFETSGPINIAGNLVPKGKYSIFAIPDSTHWELIFNNQWDQWGAYDYHKDKDLFRLEIIPEQLDSLQERLSFKFADDALKFRWEHLGFDLPITSPSSHQ
ncbi:MAG: DUF2911 domain-containing protein [Bacteroidota bacterium]